MVDLRVINSHYTLSELGSLAYARKPDASLMHLSQTTPYHIRSILTTRNQWNITAYLSTPSLE